MVTTMDNYRRPPSGKPGERQAVDGFIPVKTKTAEPNAQPYRRAVMQQQPIAVQPRPAPLSIDELEADDAGRHYRHPVIRRRTTAKRAVLRTAMVAMALFVGVSGLLTTQGFWKLSRMFKGSAAPVAALQKNVDPNLLKSEGAGRINVLLLGIGGGTHDGPDLTDSIMLASIDPVNNKATLISVPRDLWVSLPGHGSMKINAAYETGKYGYLGKDTADNSNSKAIQAGFTSADQVLESVLGVPINYNLLVNFQAFQQAVDTVGGVTVDVPTDLYDPTMAWQNGWNPYLARAGVQNFTGPQALNYVRSRETSSDFARAQRQRAVLMALKQKVVSLGVMSNPAKLSGLISAFGNNVQTDMSLSDATRLYGIFKKINSSNVTSASLAGDTTTTSSAAGSGTLVTTGMLNGQSIVMPTAGLDNYQAIQDYVHAQLPDGYLLKEHARVDILNGTSNPVLAQTKAALLKSYGYDVTNVSDTPSGSVDSTVVIDLSHGKDPYTKHYLEQRFSTTATTRLPAGISYPQNTDFVVLLGGDETGSN